MSSGNGTPEGDAWVWVWVVAIVAGVVVLSYVFELIVRWRW